MMVYASPTLVALVSGWLLWTHRFVSALPTPEQSTPLAINVGDVETTTILPLGDICSKNEDCVSDSGLICDVPTLKCVCKDENKVISPEGKCLPIRSLSQECKFAMQCRSAGLDPNSTDCVGGFCACKPGYMSNQSLCLNDNQGDHTIRRQGPKPYQMETNMIIIIVVLAIMFFGMCLALHLFSRARFRNHRTIFNSPHPRLMHIKLGKEKKGHRRTSHSSLQVPVSRHPSICSQLSTGGPPRSRPGSRMGSRRGSRAGSTTGSPNSVRSFQKDLERGVAEKLGAPIAKLDDTTSPTFDNTKKDNWKPSNPGPDVVKEASVVQNGPNSPTIIVTNISNSRSSSEAHSPGSATRV